MSKSRQELNKDIGYQLLFNMGDGREYNFLEYEDGSDCVVLTVSAKDGTTFKHTIYTEEIQ